MGAAEPAHPAAFGGSHRKGYINSDGKGVSLPRLSPSGQPGYSPVQRWDVQLLPPSERDLFASWRGEELAVNGGMEVRTMMANLAETRWIGSVSSFLR